MAAGGQDRPDRPAWEDDTRDHTLPQEEWPVPPEYRTPAHPMVSDDEPPARSDETLVIPGPSSRRLRPRPATAAALALVLLALLGGALAYGLRDDPSREPADVAGAAGGGAPTGQTGTTETRSTEREARVTVPDLEGMAVAEARERLTALGLEPDVRETDSDRDEGEVLQHMPAADEDVERGATVTLVVSSGPEEVAVPNVVGLSRARASAALRDRGLEVDARTEPSSRRPGTVVEQDPEAGAKVERGSRARIVVAVEPEPARVSVPGVVGLPVADARARLQRRGLRSTVTRVESSRPAGVVVAQSPGAGSSVEKGTKVELEVSSGPALVTVPDVVGFDESSARQQLTDAGFQVRALEEPTADPAQVGLVVSQSPSGGAQTRKGAVVTVTIAVAS